MLKKYTFLQQPPQYNQEQMDLLKKIFETFDYEKTGSAVLKIIPMTLSTLGVKMKPEELDALIKETDKDGSGKIEFSEYIELAKKYIEPEDDFNKLYAELRQVFMIFDKGSRFNPKQFNFICDYMRLNISR